jgi:uncharacterized membrane protein YtjA (UPF0391 family)
LVGASYPVAAAKPTAHLLTALRHAGTKARRHGFLGRDEGGGGLAMLEYAVIFLLVALITGTLGLTNLSDMARRVSLALFAVFFLMFLALVSFAYLAGSATA